jgi:hypothetical protein
MANVTNESIKIGQRYHFTRSDGFIAEVIAKKSGTYVDVRVVQDKGYGTCVGHVWQDEDLSDFWYMLLEGQDKPC